MTGSTELETSTKFSVTEDMLNWFRLCKFRISILYPLCALVGAYLVSSDINFGFLPGIGFILLVAAGVYMMNDVYDMDIDSETNTNRPLVSGKVEPRPVLIVSTALIVIGNVGLLLFSIRAVFAMFIFGLLGVLYSVPPIRLRKYLFSPYLIIGSGAMLSFLAGVALAGRNPYSSNYILGGMLLFAFFMGGSTSKEFKDVESDMKAGVATIPTVLGMEKASKLTAIIYLSSFIFPMIFVYIFGYPDYFLGIIGAILMGAIFTWKRFLSDLYDQDIIYSSFKQFAMWFMITLLLLLIGALLTT